MNVYERDRRLSRYLFPSFFALPVVMSLCKKGYRLSQTNQGECDIKTQSFGSFGVCCHAHKNAYSNIGLHWKTSAFELTISGIPIGLIVMMGPLIP